ncbi:MAG: multidrug efflux MFS transporter [Clostridiaceae bacterium]|nr:multidrug efflux MFS transporter [Clostridiaceae bacterium]
MERWKVNLYTVWFSQILSLTSFGFGIPFLPYYIQQMGVNDPDTIKFYIGVLGAAPAVTMAVMSPVWGMVSDRWGKKVMLLRAMFFASIVIAGMGLATRVEHLLVLRLVQGMFTGTVTASSALVATNTPGKRLPFALGFMSSSTFIGMSAGPLLGGFFAEYAGYRISFFIGAALMFLDFFIVLFLVKEEKVPECSMQEEKKGNPFISILSSRTIISMLIILFILRISRNVFSPYLPLLVQEVRSEIEGSARITGIINGLVGFMTALSGGVISFWGERYGKVKVLRILLLLSILISLPLFLLNNLWYFSILYSLFFFAMGGIEPILTSVTSLNTPPDRRGTLFGIQGLVGSIGWSVSPLIGGAVSIGFDTKAVLLVIPIVLLLGVFSLSLFKPVLKESL